jgi:hypothetical protein
LLALSAFFGQNYNLKLKHKLELKNIIANQTCVADTAVVVVDDVAIDPAVVDACDFDSSTSICIKNFKLNHIETRFRRIIIQEQQLLLKLIACNVHVQELAAHRV